MAATVAPRVTTWWLGKRASVRRMRRRWFDRYNRALLRVSPWLFRGVLTTPPAVADPSAPVVLYTLLHKRGVRPYLLAAKSFLRFCPGLEVVVQSDGTLDQQSRGELERHLVNVKIVSRQETDDFLREWLGGASLGSTWRLAGCPSR